MDDYINGYLDRCVDVICARHGIDKLNLLGICQGGAFSLCYASMHPEKVRNLVTMVTPVDFKTPDNMLSHWVQNVDIDLLVDTQSNIPGEMLNWTFLNLKPYQLMAQKYLGVVDLMDDPEGTEELHAHGKVDLRQPGPGWRDLPSVHQGLLPAEQADEGRGADR